MVFLRGGRCIRASSIAANAHEGSWGEGSPQTLAVGALGGSASFRRGLETVLGFTLEEACTSWAGACLGALLCTALGAWMPQAAGGLRGLHGPLLQQAVWQAVPKPLPPTLSVRGPCLWLGRVCSGPRTEARWLWTGLPRAAQPRALRPATVHPSLSFVFCGMGFLTGLQLG